jgi:hypothetical protein
MQRRRQRPHGVERSPVLESRIRPPSGQSNWQWWIASTRSPGIRRSSVDAWFCDVCPVLQRVVGVLELLVAGMLSLPLAAYLLDDQGAENWIVPVQLLVVAVIVAGVTFALPALARVGAPTGRRALTGVCWGLLASFVGVLVFWLLLSGLRGA